MRDKVTTDAYRFELLQKAQKSTGKNNSMIAREIELSRPTVIAVMNGDSDRLGHIEAVAKALGLSLSDLFTKAA